MRRDAGDVAIGRVQAQARRQAGCGKGVRRLVRLDLAKPPRNHQVITTARLLAFRHRRGDRSGGDDQRQRGVGGSGGVGRGDRQVKVPAAPGTPVMALAPASKPSPAGSFATMNEAGGLRAVSGRANGAPTVPVTARASSDTGAKVGAPSITMVQAAGRHVRTLPKPTAGPRRCPRPSACRRLPLGSCRGSDRSAGWRR